MRILVVGGGPAGLYFSILMKKLDPRHQVTLVERNAPDQTFGWGVVFSDETLGNLETQDAKSFAEITRTFARWSDIDVHYRGELVRSGGHGFSGIARVQLLRILHERAAELGVELRFRTEVDDLGGWPGYDLVVAADGVRSRLREAHADVFKPSLELGTCRYIWLGTRRLFDAFTFLFEESPHGWFQVHAYRFDAASSTFIAETDEATWRRAGLDRASPEESVAFLERLFARHLQGERLLLNRSSWINFVTVRNETWRHGSLVLLGDAAHTAHFSIGSGTKLALEDAIALAQAFRETSDVKTALERYDEERRPVVARTQRAAESSRRWFENVPRYARLEPLQLAMSLLTRSRKVSYENLKLRDPRFIDRVAAWYARNESAAGPELLARTPPPPPPPPMFTPFRLRGLTLRNRVVVSPMCMYSARDGAIDDFHLVHLGARALGGAGLVMTEMTCVTREGRITPGCAGMYAPEHLPLWRRVVEFVHTHTRAHIGMQLGHSGRKGSTRLMWQGMDEPLAEGGWPLLAPSPLAYKPGNVEPRAMDRADMDAVRDAFVRAARMAEEAGFDLLELHMAHGYLLASFLSPLTNRRADGYGGSLENRMRFPLEVFAAVRAAWPEAKPMSVRISATDWVEGGLVPEDAVVFARALRAAGLDLLDVSTGQTVPEQQPVYGRMWQAPFSDQLRNETPIPTVTVGAISTHDEVDSILAAGRADLCAIGRPHLADPNWTLHAAAALGFDEERWPLPYHIVQPKPRPPAGGPG